MYLKKVPGNFHFSFHGKGAASVLFGKVYSLEHTIHLMEFTTEKDEVSLG